MRTQEEWTGILERNGLPAPVGRVLDMRHPMTTQDWWVRTDQGWLWLRGPGPHGETPDRREWVPAPHGPP